MKLYAINYTGKLNGGLAIVFAENEEEALKKVSADEETINFNVLSVKELEQNGVIYNNSGDC